MPLITISFPNKKFNVTEKLRIIYALEDLTDMNRTQCFTIVVPNTSHKISVKTPLNDKHFNSISDSLSSLMASGCKIQYAGAIIAQLQKVAELAAKMNEDELADEILKIVIIHKLKNGE